MLHTHDLLEWCTGQQGISGQKGQKSTICLDRGLDVSAGLHSTLESLGDSEASEEIPQKQDQSTKLPEKSGGKQAKSKFPSSSFFFYAGWTRRHGSDLGGTYPFQMIQSRTFLFQDMLSQKTLAPSIPQKFSHRRVLVDCR